MLVPRFRRSGAGVLLQGLEFDPSSVNVRFLVDSVVLGQCGTGTVWYWDSVVLGQCGTGTV